MGLKGIPSIISPELLKTLAEMGHGDTIVLADAHFPAHSIARSRGCQVIRADGVKSIAELMKGILQLIDLDTYIKHPMTLMEITDVDKAKGLRSPLPNWLEYFEIASEASDGRNIGHACAERFAFYEKAGQAFVIVITSDTSLYGNIILTKGVLPKEQ